MKSSARSPRPDSTCEMGEGRVPADADLDAVVTAYFRVGWSADAVHVHVHVDEPGGVIAPSPTGLVYDGDAIELYLSPLQTRTGYYGPGSDVGAQVIVAAPSADSMPEARWEGLLWIDPDSGTTSSSVAPSGLSVAARRVAGGYEVEMQVPWTWVAAFAQGPATVPGGGSVIGLDFAVDVSDGVSMRAFQSSLRVEGPALACPVGALAPFCDDRMWCSPTLAPWSNSFSIRKERIHRKAGRREVRMHGK